MRGIEFGGVQERNESKPEVAEKLAELREKAGEAREFAAGQEAAIEDFKAKMAEKLKAMEEELERRKDVVSGIMNEIAAVQDTTGDVPSLAELTKTNEPVHEEKPAEGELTTMELLTGIRDSKTIKIEGDDRLK